MKVEWTGDKFWVIFNFIQSVSSPVPRPSIETSKSHTRSCTMRFCPATPSQSNMKQSQNRDQRDSRFSRILENFFSFSLLVLDLEPFQFHFHFSKKSEGILFFTFHFSEKMKAIRILLFFLEKLLGGIIIEPPCTLFN